MRIPVLPPAVPPEEFAARRRRILAKIGDGVLIVGSGRVVRYSAAVEHRFRPESDFHYLTGFPEPDAVLVLRNGVPEPATLFVPPKNREEELRTGHRYGPEGAVASFGLDAAYSLDQFDTRLPDLLDGASRVYFAPFQDAKLDASLQQALRLLKGKEFNGRFCPDTLVDPGALLHELRLIKSQAELELIEQAALITATGIQAALARLRPGTHEYQIQALLEAAFLANGATGPGFASIVAAGANSCVLHYTTNRGPIADGDLVLLDVGAEFGGYNGDISRTVPANGRFTPAQRTLYQAVLEAEEAAIAAIRPGGSFHEIHDTAVKSLSGSLVDLGLLTGPVEVEIETGAYRRYFPHRTSHWLGVDVHDVGRTRQDGKSRPLASGMVFTVEPGLYIPEDDDQAPPEFRGLGIRIEDDVVVTPDHFRLITRMLPVEPEAVAALVGKG